MMIRYSRFTLVAAAFSFLLQGCSTSFTTKTISAGSDLNQVRNDASNSASRTHTDIFFSNVETLLAFQSQNFSFVSPGNDPVNAAGNVYVLDFGSSLMAVQLGGSATGTTSSAQTVLRQPWSLRFAAAAQNGTSETQDLRDLSDAMNAAANSVKDTGTDSSGLIGWGRWTNATTRINGAAVGCCSNNQSLHYVFGTASPNSAIPLSGTATYSLVGGTSPTLSDGSAAPGVLTSGTVGVVWGGASANTHIALDLQGTINGYTFLVQSPTGNDSPVIYDPVTRTFSGSWEQVGSAALSSASGFFAGANAQAIALTYSTPATVGGVSSPTVSIQGAAGFRRQ